MRRLVFCFILFNAFFVVRCNSGTTLPTPRRAALVATASVTNTSHVAPSNTPSVTATKTHTQTAPPRPSHTHTTTATVTFTPTPTRTATRTATKTATNVPAEQLALKHFLEGRAWLNATDPKDVSIHAARYFTGKALQQTLEEAQWEIENGVRYQVGELTENLWSAKSDESILIFENTRAGKAVQYDANWQAVNTFEVNPLSMVYVMIFDATDGRWKVSHTKSAVDKVTGKSLLAE